MGDIGSDRDLPGYQSPESRRLESLDARLAGIEAEVDRLRRYVEGRAREQREAYRRMMNALAGATGRKEDE